MFNSEFKTFLLTLMFFIGGCSSTTTPAELGYQDLALVGEKISNLEKSNPSFSNTVLLVEPIVSTSTTEHANREICISKLKDPSNESACFSTSLESSRALPGYDAFLASVLKKSGFDARALSQGVPMPRPSDDIFVVKVILTEASSGVHSSNNDASQVGYLGTLAGVETDKSVNFIRMDVAIYKLKTHRYVASFHSAGNYMKSKTEFRFWIFTGEQKTQSLLSTSLRLTLLDIGERIRKLFEER